MTKLSSHSLKLALAAGTMLLAAPVMAHTGHDHVHASGFGAGLFHPVSGWDHILAMVAVGLWAAQRGGRSLWALPVAFVGVMALGALAGLAGLPVPLVEAGIASSMLVLGLLVATAVRLPMVAAVGLTGLFAFFHGHAHGTELSAGMSATGYMLGFAISTMALHGAGIGAGLAAQQFARDERLRDMILRTGGGLVTAAAVLVIVGGM